MQAATSPRFNRVLLTNDDGVDAPGMDALVRAVTPLAREVWVVAPEHDQSGASRAVSLHAPLRLWHKAERRIGVGGTPSDAAIMGLRNVLAGAPPDIVISGINRGANLGHEVAYSGTVSAAMTAKLLGVPAIAFSQAFRDRDQVRWDTAVDLVPRVFDHLDSMGGWAGVLGKTVLNVNFPDLPADEVAGFAFTRQASGALLGIDVESRTDTRNVGYHWLAFRRSHREQADDSDIGALRRGMISLTPLGFDFTDTVALAELAGG